MAIEIDQNTIIRLLVRRGSEAERNSIILAQGEPGFALDSKVLVVGDGLTYGGVKIPSVDNTTIEWSGTTPNYIQIKDGGVSNVKLQSVNGNTLKGNNTPNVTSPIDIPISNNSLVGRLDNINSGNITSLTIPVIFNNIFSPTAPSPTFLGFWVNTTNNRLYFYDGANWLSKHQYAPNGPERLLYVGSGASVATYDGGNSTAASVSGGAMWEIDTDYTAKVLRGAVGGTSATIPFETGGQDTQQLTISMIPQQQHYHGFGDTWDPNYPGDDDLTFNQRSWTSTQSFGQSVLRSLMAGGSGPRHSGFLGTTDAIPVSDGVSSPPSPVPTIPAFRGILVLKRTSRVYYTA